MDKLPIPVLVQILQHSLQGIDEDAQKMRCLCSFSLVNHKFLRASSSNTLWQGFKLNDRDMLVPLGLSPSVNGFLRFCCSQTVKAKKIERIVFPFTDYPIPLTLPDDVVEYVLPLVYTGDTFCSVFLDGNVLATLS